MRQKTAKKEAWRPKCAAPSLFYGSAPGRKIGGEMLRWRTFLAQHFPRIFRFLTTSRRRGAPCRPPFFGCRAYFSL